MGLHFGQEVRITYTQQLAFDLSELSRKRHRSIHGQNITIYRLRTRQRLCPRRDPPLYEHPRRNGHRDNVVRYCEPLPFPPSSPETLNH